MTDLQTDETTSEIGIADPDAGKEKKPRVVKEKAAPHLCLCAYFEVGVFSSVPGAKDEEIFTTGCEATTLSTFGQGHDARLVGFLVSAHFDGYSLRLVKDGKTTVFETPAQAAAVASEALGVKAAKATERKAELLAKSQAVKTERAEKKALRDSEKAAAKEERARLKALAKAEGKEQAANTPHTEVAAGSYEGDRPPLTIGQARIKVGRWEYDATINEDETATFVDGKGDEQTVERDAYRVLAEAA